MRNALLVSAVIACLTGCGSGSSDAAPPISAGQCMKDIDCKGDRICDQGVCQAPVESAIPCTQDATTIDNSVSGPPASPMVSPLEISEHRAALDTGVLEVVGEMREQELQFASRAIRPQGFLYDLVQGFNLGDRQIVLVAEYSGGTACPATYFFVEADSAGSLRQSDDFGTCSDLPVISMDGQTIVVTMPGHAGQSTYRYAEGVVSDQ